MSSADGLQPAGRFATFPFISTTIVLAALWALLAWGVMPLLLERAYHGHGLSLLMRLMDHRNEHSLQFYQHKWSVLALKVLLGGIGAALLVRFSLTRYVAERVAGSATPGTIGAIRVLVFALLAVIASQFGLARFAVLPAVQRHGVGVMNWFYAAGLDRIVSSPQIMSVLQWVCVGAALLAMIGFQCRWTLPLATLLYLPLAGIDRSYFWVSHAGLVPFYAAVVLCFVRSGDGWSVDRWMRICRGEPVPPKEVATPYYGWARLMVWLVILVPYLCAGMSKLRNGGWTWWDANNMQQLLFADGLRPSGESPAMKLLWLPPTAFAFVGIMTLVCELGVISILFSRRLRRIFPPMMFAMHFGIYLVMGINFLGLMCLQVVFYDWTPVGRWIQRRISDEAAREPVTTRIISAASRMRFAPFAASAIVVLFLGTWSLHAEFYPLSSWQMFSSYTPGTKVSFYRSYVTYEDGTVAPAEYERMGGAVPRYGAMLKYAFMAPAGRDACVRLMKRSANWWNRHVSESGKRIVHFETRLNQWDFAAQRENRDAVDVVQTIALDIPSVEDAQATND